MPAHVVPAAQSPPPPPPPPPPTVPYGAAEPRFRRCVRKFFAHLFSNLGLFGLVAGYVIVGAFVFRFLEAGNEREQRDRIGRLKNDCLGELWNITGKRIAFQGYLRDGFCSHRSFGYGPGGGWQGGNVVGNENCPREPLDRIPVGEEERLEETDLLTELRFPEMAATDRYAIIPSRVFFRKH